MNQNTVGRWIGNTFRETPWTAWLITINIVTWLLVFFQVPAPARILTGTLGVETAWVWLTYPLVTPTAIHWFILFLYVFHWVGTSLERQWGSQKFGRVFVVVTLVTACAYWLGEATIQQTLNPTVNLAGLTLPELTMFVIWGALNAEATILAFFVLPIKAKHMAWASLFLAYFQIGPVLGLFIISVPLAGWFWAKGTGAGLPPTSTRGKTIGERLQERKREQRKSRFKILEGKGRAEDGPQEVSDIRKLNREVEAKQKSAEAEELDRILDKIRFEGMASLSVEERDTLDRQSRKLKGES